MKTQEKAVTSALLKELRLPTMAKLWETLNREAVDKSWGYSKYLTVLCEHELNNRNERRLQRRMKESQLPRAKSMATFDFSSVPSVDKEQIAVFASGHLWVNEGENILIFGPSGIGKSHLAAAIGEKLIDNEYRVMFIRTTELVQKLQAAKNALSLPAMLDKLDKYDCIILDDFGYVKKDQQETDVLFEFICDRYESKSLIVTSNQTFSEWNDIFSSEAMTIAATDRLVHHATIIEMKGESFRKKTAIAKASKKKKK